MGLAHSVFFALPFIILGLAFALGSVRSRPKRNPRNLPYPPGPPGRPILGNILDVPAKEAWLAYDKMAQKYGDMVYITMLGQPFLILSSVKRARDLLEKQSKNYSDRMQATMVIELMGWSFAFGMQPYGPSWRMHRRQFHQYFHPTAIEEYKPIQMDEARAFAARLLSIPEKFQHQIRRTFAGTIMRICYGIPIETDDSEYISRAEIALGGFAEAAIPGSFLVDFLPILKYVPAWMPGAEFQRKAALWKRVTNEFIEIPFAIVKDQLKRGKAPRSVAARIISGLPEEDDPARNAEETIAANVCAIAYAGGADTTLSAVQAFFYAMAMHPEVLTKAQDEIDTVVGPNRFPDFSDRHSLPYIEAICKEIMRWHMVMPLGAPHMSSEDDEYEGYFIPKGTIVLANAWSILHNPETFENPFEFRPERYMKGGEINSDLLDPMVGGAFGFGRRICPGRHLSDNTLYAIISTIISVFNIKAPLNEDGKPKKLTYEVTSGLLSYPKSFECTIEPRNKTTEKLLQSVIV